MIPDFIFFLAIDCRYFVGVRHEPGPSELQGDGHKSAHCRAKVLVGGVDYPHADCFDGE